MTERWLVRAYAIDPKQPTTVEGEPFCALQYRGALTEPFYLFTRERHDGM